MSEQTAARLAERLTRQLRISRASLDLIGEGDFTPQDAAHTMLVVVAEDAAAGLTRVTDALREARGWIEDYRKESLDDEYGFEARADVLADVLERIDAALAAGSQEPT